MTQERDEYAYARFQHKTVQLVFAYQKVFDEWGVRAEHPHIEESYQTFENMFYLVHGKSPVDVIYGDTPGTEDMMRLGGGYVRLVNCIKEDQILTVLWDAYLLDYEQVWKDSHQGKSQEETLFRTEQEMKDAEEIQRNI